MTEIDSEKSSEDDFEYPFEEFEKHFEELHEFEEFAEGDVMRNLFTVRKYMESQYGEGPESAFKTFRFSAILLYMAGNLEAFDKGNYGVNGSRESGALVSNYVLKAVHELLTNKQQTMIPDPEEVMRLADLHKLRDEEGEASCDLGDDPRTAKLVELLEERFPDMRSKRAGARGIVLLVLRWTAANAPNGDLSSYSPEVIARAVDWEGDPKALVRLLLDAGFLDENQRFIDLEKMHTDYHAFFGWAFGDK